MGELEGSITRVDLGKIKYKVRERFGNQTIYFMSEKELLGISTTPEELREKVLDHVFGSDLVGVVEYFVVKAAKLGLRKFYITSTTGDVYEVEIK
jgi:hypothetical protein